MNLLDLIVLFVVVGILMWAINAYVPMQENIKKLLNITVVIILVLFLLRALGVFSRVGNIQIG